ncbi:MAG: 50S ribosomal protein L7/L12 [bacterium]
MGDITREDVVKYIETMNVLELSDLVKELESKFGVSATAVMPMAAMGNVAASVGPAAEEEEKTEFTVTLISSGEKKIQVIKEVRAITGLGLKEAKAIVDEAPKNVKENISKAEAEAVKVKLESAGAVVEIK